MPKIRNCNTQTQCPKLRTSDFSLYQKAAAALFSTPRRPAAEGLRSLRFERRVQELARGGLRVAGCAPWSDPVVVRNNSVSVEMLETVHVPLFPIAWALTLQPFWWSAAQKKCRRTFGWGWLVRTNQEVYISVLGRFGVAVLTSVSRVPGRSLKHLWAFWKS